VPRDWPLTANQPLRPVATGCVLGESSQQMRFVDATARVMPAPMAQRMDDPAHNSRRRSDGATALYAGVKKASGPRAIVNIAPIKR